MTLAEFSDQFDVLYNNITSNQAPGLNEYEKSVVLTKAEKEVVKNYFTANSKGNNLGQGFDDSAKRQADFSLLMKTYHGEQDNSLTEDSKIDYRSRAYTFPDDVFIVVNETATFTIDNIKQIKQVIPLRYDEYTRLMSKSFKRPVKNQVWRLMNSGSMGSDGHTTTKKVELIFGPEVKSNITPTYILRYVRMPKPIIVGDLDGLKIDGYTSVNECEIDPILHDDILQRAVELAKVAWTTTGQENLQPVLAAGQRTE